MFGGHHAQPMSTHAALSDFFVRSTPHGHVEWIEVELEDSPNEPAMTDPLQAPLNDERVPIPDIPESPPLGVQGVPVVTLEHWEIQGDSPFRTRSRAQG